MATIGDVAARAGVSEATVSRVLNDKGPVAAATRTLVGAAIHDLGYRPSRIARDLSRGTLSSLAAVVPVDAGATALEAAARQLIGTGYSLSIAAAESRRALDAIFDELSGPGRAAGVISFGARPRLRDLARFRHSGIPFVVSGDRVDGMASVSVDEQRAGRLAVETLTRIGHRSIGFVGGTRLPAFVHDPTVGRHLGYVMSVTSRRSRVQRSYVARTIEGPDGADQAVRRLLSKDDPPTAIVAATPQSATAVMAAFLRRGMSVPTDISLLSIGGPTSITHILAADPGPHRAAVEIALDQTGREYASSPPVQLELGVRLIDGGSIAPPRS